MRAACLLAIGVRLASYAAESLVTYTKPFPKPREHVQQDTIYPYHPWFASRVLMQLVAQLRNHDDSGPMSFMNNKTPSKIRHRRRRT